MRGALVLGVGWEEFPPHLPSYGMQSGGALNSYPAPFFLRCQ